MNIEQFFLENTDKITTRNIKISDRFKSEFTIRPITERQNYDVKKKSRKLNDKTLDIDDYIYNLVCECTVFPDLKNEALQNSYGVIGEKNLIKNMLTAGEFLILLDEVESICGFNFDIEKESEKLKN